ncbi:hypothetical protein Tco_1304669 [Tanacetum coccineum]
MERQGRSNFSVDKAEIKGLGAVLMQRRKIDCYASLQLKIMRKIHTTHDLELGGSSIAQKDLDALSEISDRRVLGEGRYASNSHGPELVHETTEKNVQIKATEYKLLVIRPKEVTPDVGVSH